MRYADDGWNRPRRPDTLGVGAADVRSSREQSTSYGGRTRLCRARPPYEVLPHGEKVRRPRRQTFRIRSAISCLAANPAALYVATPPTLELGVHTRTLDEPISRSAAAPATVIARP
jgi:hypothetical protein